MTREERERFVRSAWFESGTAEDAVQKIVDAWENDANEAFTRGIYAEQETRGAQG